MGLDDLMGCIEVLKERMQSHSGVLQENETRTRMALIDPLLHALGWDVSDPVMVIPEYKIDNKPADYALLQPDGKPAATLEAKKLGEPLGSHRRQMLNYANMSGIEYAGLTDGNHWELYKVFQAGPLEERRILDVSIMDAPAHASALKLLLLWRPNLTSGELVPARTPILEDHQPTPPLTTHAERNPAPRPESSDWVALSDYDPPGFTPCPAAIRLWDGSERPLAHWHQIFIRAVEKLYEEKRITVEHLPIGWWGNQACRVHTEPVHPTGKQFRSPKRIEGTPPLFVDAPQSASSSRKTTKRLMRDYNINPAEVYLQPAR